MFVSFCFVLFCFVLFRFASPEATYNKFACYGRIQEMGVNVKFICLILFLNLIVGCSSNKSSQIARENCWDFIRLAVEFRKLEKFEESLEEIEKHGECDKSEERMSYHYHKGWTLYDMGKYNIAIKELMEGLKTQPAYIYAYWRIGLAYEALGDVENAQKNYLQGYEVGVREYGKKFFEYMERNPKAKEKLIQSWNT